MIYRGKVDLTWAAGSFDTRARLAAPARCHFGALFGWRGIFLLTGSTAADYEVDSPAPIMLFDMLKNWVAAVGCCLVAIVGKGFSMNLVDKAAVLPSLSLLLLAFAMAAFSAISSSARACSVSSS